MRDFGADYFLGTLWVFSLKRKAPLLAAILVVFIAVSGYLALAGETLGSISGMVSAALGLEPGGETIRIASWNIRDFGRAKATSEVRMEFIADVLRAYDIIAVQEISNIREQSDPGCPRNENACPGHKDCGLIRSALEKYLNEENGLNYSFVFSPQTRDERYLYIYNPDRVEFLGAELVHDPGDRGPVCSTSPESTGLMIRQPFKASFRAGDFDFVLLTAHTSPGINFRELEGLEYFYREALKDGEPDVIVLGDLNADCSYLSPDESISFREPEYIWVVGDDADTTVAGTDCAYDRFIFRAPTREDFTGSWGITGGIEDYASDHYLVWAEFSTERDTD
jgi:deoxyribonuclease-1-like protein